MHRTDDSGPYHWYFQHSFNPLGFDLFSLARSSSRPRQTRTIALLPRRKLRRETRPTHPGNLAPASSIAVLLLSPTVRLRPQCTDSQTPQRNLPDGPTRHVSTGSPPARANLPLGPGS